jgi:hypothetical protein
MSKLIEEARKPKRFQVFCAGRFVESFDKPEEAIGHTTRQSKIIEEGLKKQGFPKTTTVKSHWKIVDSNTGKQVY